jgi:hypothetical protein
MNEALSNDDRTLFDRTSRLAGETAAKRVGQRRQQILSAIDQHGPLAIFEIAAILDVFDHQISGRFGELVNDGLLYITGDRRKKPETGQVCEVYARREQTSPDYLQTTQHGYPPTITVGSEGVFDRSYITGDRDLPGVPYARRGPARETWRVEVIECPGCGRSLKFTPRREAGQELKEFRCNTPTCNRVWQLTMIAEPGRAAVLALVMKHL